MDLQSVKVCGTDRSPISKLTVMLCFALACGLLIGSLLSASHAAAAREANVTAPELVRTP